MITINFYIIISTFIFYLIGIFILFFIIKTKLFSLQGYYYENAYILNLGFKILLLIFSILFISVFLV